MNRGRLQSAFVALLLGLAAWTVQAQTPFIISLNAQMDTRITQEPSSGGPDSVHGMDSIVCVYGKSGVAHRTLVKFTLPGVGPGINLISNASVVRLYYVPDTLAGESQSLTIGLAESLVTWDESSTWNSLGGGSYTTPYLSETVVTVGGAPRYIDFPIPDAVINNWLQNPSSNRGLIFVTGSNQIFDWKNFASRESTTYPFPPILEIHAIPEPAVALLLVGGSGALLGRRRRTQA